MEVAKHDKSNTIVKEIMACLYGSLCSRKKTYLSLNNPVNIDGDKEVIDIDDHRVGYTEKGKLFKYNFARLGSFLTAFARLKMAETIYPIRERIYKYITDSILSDIPLDDIIKVGDELGEWKANTNNGKQATITKNGKKTVWEETL